MQPANDAAGHHLIRETIERQIEELILLLDRLDGDCDFEDDQREDDARRNPVPVYGDNQSGPVLAWTGGQGAALAAFRADHTYRDMERPDHAS